MRPARRSGSRRSGITLLEVAVTAFLLAMMAVPIWGLLQTSSRGIRRVDERKEARYLVQEVMNRVESADFIVLYRYFGIEPNSSQRIQVGLTAGSENPLQVPQHVLDSLKQRGWQVALTFRFMTKEEVGWKGIQSAATAGSADPEASKGSAELFAATSSGIQHLQGGFLDLQVSGPGLRTQQIRRPIYCPLILGRPGLMVSQCPALNPAVKRELFSNIP